MEGELPAILREPDSGVLVSGSDKGGSGRIGRAVRSSGEALAGKKCFLDKQ